MIVIHLCLPDFPIQILKVKVNEAVKLEQDENFLKQDENHV